MFVGSVQESTEQEPLLRNSSSNEEIFSSPPPGTETSVVERSEDPAEAISFCGALKIPVSFGELVIADDKKHTVCGVVLRQYGFTVTREGATLDKHWGKIIFKQDFSINPSCSPSSS